MTITRISRDNNYAIAGSNINNITTIDVRFMGMFNELTLNTNETRSQGAFGRAVTILRHCIQVQQNSTAIGSKSLTLRINQLDVGTPIIIPFGATGLTVQIESIPVADIDLFDDELDALLSDANNFRFSWCIGYHA